MPVTILQGGYPYFSVIALVVMIMRIRRKLWTRAETLLLVCVLLHATGEILQIVIGDAKSDLPRRYLLPVAPLLFAWTAYGLCRLWRSCRNWPMRTVLVAAAAELGAVLIYDGMLPTIKNRRPEYQKSERTRLVIEAARIIRKNYRGISEERPPVHKLMYRSPYRPVVFGKFPYAAFAAGGRAEPSPFLDKPDFWVLRIEEPPPADAVKIADVDTGGARYAIYQAVARRDAEQSAP